MHAPTLKFGIDINKVLIEISRAGVEFPKDGAGDGMGIFVWGILMKGLIVLGYLALYSLREIKISGVRACPLSLQDQMRNLTVVEIVFLRVAV